MFDIFSPSIFNEYSIPDVPVNLILWFYPVTLVTIKIIEFIFLAVTIRAAAVGKNSKSYPNDILIDEESIIDRILIVKSMRLSKGIQVFYKFPLQQFFIIGISN